MNLTSIITTLAVLTATSTAALAKPVRFDVQAQASWTTGYQPAGPTVRDHRNNAPAPVVRDYRTPDYRTPVYNRPRTEPQLFISLPQVDQRQNLSTYVGTLGTTGS